MGPHSRFHLPCKPLHLPDLYELAAYLAREGQWEVYACIELLEVGHRWYWATICCPPPIRSYQSSSWPRKQTKRERQPIFQQQQATTMDPSHRESWKIDRLRCAPQWWKKMLATSDWWKKYRRAYWQIWRNVVQRHTTVEWGQDQVLRHPKRWDREGTEDYWRWKWCDLVLTDPKWDFLLSRHFNAE